MTTTPTTTTVSPPGLAAFDAKANAICTRYNALIGESPSIDVTQPITVAQGKVLADFFEKGVTYSKREMAEVRALPRPAAYAVAIGRVLDQISAMSPVVQTAVRQLRAGQTEQGTATISSLPSAPIEAAFTLLGMTACSA